MPKKPEMSRHEGWGKFKRPDEAYFHYIDELLKMEVEPKDLVYQFPVFVGHVNLARFLFFYDLYKQVVDLNGHLADIGTYKGASFLFFAKVVRLFEPNNCTQVYGFDWFQGMKPGQADNAGTKGKYSCSKESLDHLVRLQELEDVALLQQLDLVKESAGFLKARPHLRFKLIFVDCGIQAVLESVLKHFWPRLVSGGILIMDHYNCEASPTESGIVEKYVGDRKILQMPFNRQPTAYIKK